MPRTPEQKSRNAEYTARWRKANPGWKGRQRRAELMRRYGITLEDYNDLFDRQRGVCAICDEFSKRRLSVDHCHATNRNRGLLCDNCNLGLGKFRDNPFLLRRAAKYIEQ